MTSKMVSDVVGLDCSEVNEQDEIDLPEKTISPHGSPGPECATLFRTAPKKEHIHLRIISEVFGGGRDWS